MLTYTPIRTLQQSFFLSLPYSYWTSQNPLSSWLIFQRNMHRLRDKPVFHCPCVSISSYLPNSLLCLTCCIHHFLMSSASNPYVLYGLPPAWTSWSQICAGQSRPLEMLHFSKAFSSPCSEGCLKTVTVLIGMKNKCNLISPARRSHCESLHRPCPWLTHHNLNALIVHR